MVCPLPARYLDGDEPERAALPDRAVVRASGNRRHRNTHSPVTGIVFSVVCKRYYQKKRAFVHIFLRLYATCECGPTQQFF